MSFDFGDTTPRRYRPQRAGAGCGSLLVAGLVAMIVTLSGGLALGVGYYLSDPERLNTMPWGVMILGMVAAVAVVFLFLVLIVVLLVRIASRQ